MSILNRPGKTPAGLWAERFLKLFGLDHAVVPFDNPETGEIEMKFVTTEQAVVGTGEQYMSLTVTSQYLYSRLEIGRRRTEHDSRVLDEKGRRFAVSERIPDAKARYELFSYAIGHPTGFGTEATQADTNLYLPMRLECPEHFAISIIGVLFAPSVDPAMRNSFAERYAVKLWIGRKCYWTSPVAALFAVGEIDKLDGPAMGFAALKVPVILPPMMDFWVSLEGNPQESDELSLWAVLGELRANGVQ